MSPGRLRRVYRDARYARRTRTRLTDEEVWNLNESLARVVADAVARLRDMGHGYPSEITDGEWRGILTRMADGFAEYAADKTDPDVPREALDLLVTWWPHLWD